MSTIRISIVAKDLKFRILIVRSCFVRIYTIKLPKNSNHKTQYEIFKDHIFVSYLKTLKSLVGRFNENSSLNIEKKLVEGCFYFGIVFVNKIQGPQQES